MYWLVAQESTGPTGELRQSLDQLGDAGVSMWNGVGGFLTAWAQGPYAWVLGIAVAILVWRIFLKPLFSR